MVEAVIVATARTPIGKASRGAFNDTARVDLAAPVVAEVIRRAGLSVDHAEEVVLGCGYPEGTTGGNVARHAAIRAGLPVESAAVTVSRFCASGLDAIAYAAKRILVDGVTIAVAGGVESISLVQPNTNRVRYANDWMLERLAMVAQLVDAQRRADELKCWIKAYTQPASDISHPELNRMVAWVAAQIDDLERSLDPERVSETLLERELFPEVDPSTIRRASHRAIASGATPRR